MPVSKMINELFSKFSLTASFGTSCLVLSGVLNNLYLIPSFTLVLIALTFNKLLIRKTTDDFNKEFALVGFIVGSSCLISKYYDFSLLALIIILSIGCMAMWVVISRELDRKNKSYISLEGD